MRLNLMHASMQFSDNTAQKQEDCDAIFGRARTRGVAWVTGTEAGQVGAGSLRDVLKDASREYGYRFACPRGQDSWIAVNKEIITGPVNTFYEPTMKAGEGVGHHSARGCFTVDFEAGRLGNVMVSPYHLLTRGRPAPAPAEQRVNLTLNREMMAAIGARLSEHTVGDPEALAFIGADTNIPTPMDEFLGQPLVSAQGILGVNPGTGHGPIDVIGCHKADLKRVTWVYVRALDDSEFRLHTDHFVLEAGCDVDLLPKPPQPVEHTCPACGLLHTGLLLTP